MRAKTLACVDRCGRARVILVAATLGACGSSAATEPSRSTPQAETEPIVRAPAGETPEAEAPLGEAPAVELAAEVREAEAPRAEPDGPRRCAALPAARPAGLVIHLHRREAPVGGSPTWLRTALVPRGAPCPTPTAQELAIDRGLGATRRCRSPEDAALDALWSRLTALNLGRIRAHTLTGASPHRGGVTIELTWDGGACELSDMVGSVIDDGSRDDFMAAVSAIDAAMAAAAPAETTCVAETSPPPLLTAYDQAQRGTRHRIEVRWDDGAREWMPGRLAMPMHHASRFEYVNLDAYAAIDAWRARPLVFTVTALEVAIAPPTSGREREWRATYRVRIDSVCGVE